MTHPCQCTGRACACTTPRPPRILPSCFPFLNARHDADRPPPTIFEFSSSASPFALPSPPLQRRPNPTARQAKRGCEAVAEEGSSSQAKPSGARVCSPPIRPADEVSARDPTESAAARMGVGIRRGVVCSNEILRESGGECGIPCGRGSRPRRRAACA